MADGYDVAVVGGGICGLAAALALAVSGEQHGGGPRVLLVNDRGLGGGAATLHNGGTLHNGASYALGTSAASRDEAESCRATVGAAGSVLPPSCVIGRESGYLVSRAHTDRYRTALDRLGVRHRLLPRDALARVLQPDRMRDVDGLLVDEMQIDVAETMLRFTQACLTAGVKIVTGRAVTAIADDGRGTVAGVRLARDEVLAARHVVICAGGGTAALLRGSVGPRESLLRHIHQHRALQIVIPEGEITTSLRGVERGFPVATQLRGGKAISLYGVPPLAEPMEAVRHVLKTFRSWFLPGTLEMDDVLAVTQVDKVEFHDPRLARCTLPRVLSGRDLGVAGAFCVIPGKISHAIALALGLPRMLGFGEVPAASLRDRLDCRIGPQARDLSRVEEGTDW